MVIKIVSAGVKAAVGMVKEALIGGSSSTSSDGGSLEVEENEKKKEGEENK